MSQDFVIVEWLLYAIMDCTRTIENPNRFAVYDIPHETVLKNAYESLEVFNRELDNILSSASDSLIAFYNESLEEEEEYELWFKNFRPYGEQHVTE